MTGSSRDLGSAFWLADLPGIDVHAGFRGTFDAPTGGVRLRAQAVSAFRVWVDGALVVHGPVRYAVRRPAVTEVPLTLTAGRHAVEVEALVEGVVTRTVADVPPFVWVEVVDADDHVVPVRWRGRSLLDQFPPSGRRTSPLLGWIEVQDLRRGDWRGLGADEAGWREVTVATDAIDRLGPWQAEPVASPLCAPVPMTEVARGGYVDTYGGYVLDDPAVQFLLADPDPPAGLAPDGRWYRYDLDRVRIGSVELDVEVERDAVVIIAYADRLTPEGRPSPVIALSTGPTAFVQRFLLAPGRTMISPLQTLGGRYVEVRIETDGETVLHAAEFRERDLLGEPVARFRSGDPRLDRIWQVGLDTQRSAAEDSLVDSIRERGEWLGDAVTASLPLLQHGWGRTDLVRRTVRHAAAGARDDGLVAGCGPGELIFVGTYAAQWTTACLQLAVAERSTVILHELADAARANVTTIAALIDDDGRHRLPWCFVDWGYAIDDHEPDVAVLAHALVGVRSWQRWLVLLDRADEAAGWASEIDRLTSLITRHLPAARSTYQATTLAAHAQVIDAEQAAPVLLAALRSGFPFDRTAARLKDPTTWVPNAITPYFTNYAMPVLLDAGRGPEVAELWRSGWGWMLDEGATTWWEVFDHRWSRCHAWSGAPTWQLSQRVLGLQPADDLTSWTVTVNTLGLPAASGVVATPAGAVRIDWHVEGDHLLWRAEADHLLRLVGDSGAGRVTERRLRRVRGDLYTLPTAGPKNSV